MRDTHDRRRQLARAGAGLVALACVCSSALGLFAYFSSTQNQYVVALASFAPFLIAASVVGAIVAAVGKRWILFAATVTALAVGATLFGPLYVPGTRAGASAPEGSKTTIRLMQANLMLGEADPDNVVNLVDENDIGLLTVQELTRDSEAALDASGIEALLPYKFTRPTPGGGGGAGIYSRYPISAERELPVFVLSNLVVDLDIGTDEPLQVYSVHPVPPYPTPSSLWAAEMQLLRNEVDVSNARKNVVVSGDFNSTHSHSRFRDLLDAGYEDAADRTGQGFIPTYPTDKGYPAIVGIDHILTKGPVATSLERITVDGSDHHGLIAELVPLP